MILKNTGELPGRPQRIISLVPSQTELLYSLGLEEQTIAITKFCVHPEEWFNNKARIGGTKALNMEKIRELQPDLIIANYEENVKEQVESLAEEFPVWVTNVRTIKDAYRMITDIGLLTQTEIKADALKNDIEREISKWQVLPRSQKQQKAAYLIWKDPYMTAGGDSFIHSMMSLAGLDNVFGMQERYPEVTIDDIRDSGCEVVLLSSEPYPFGPKHATELAGELPGVAVILVDGEVFSWYGSRMLHAPAFFHKMWQNIESYVADTQIPDPSLFLQKPKK